MYICYWDSESCDPDSKHCKYYGHLYINSKNGTCKHIKKVEAEE